MNASHPTDALIRASSSIIREPLDRLDFEPADLTRQHRPEDAGVVERLDQRRRNAPVVKRRRVLADQRLERTRDLEERGTFAMSDVERTRVERTRLDTAIKILRIDGGNPATLGS